MLKVAIDLTWLKPGESGGIEFYARNLMRGLAKLNDDRAYIVLLSKDNVVLKHDFAYSHKFVFYQCDTFANKVLNRIIWQNVCFNRLLKSLCIDVCLTPFYSIPLVKSRTYKSIVVIHDLQAFHYPDYFSMPKRLWLSYAWRKSANNADVIVTISNFCKDDILHYYGSKVGTKLRVVYNPIDVSSYLTDENLSDSSPFMYTICSKYKHKNLITLVRVIGEIVHKKLQLPSILYVTGMKSFPDEIGKEIERLGIKKNIVLTGYISNEQRNDYYKKCRVFLFPSIFEGFGMPPVEAMLLKKPVVTTHCTSLPEVTQNKAIYVTNPFCIDDWIQSIESALAVDYNVPVLDSSRYNYVNTAKTFVGIIESLAGVKSKL